MEILIITLNLKEKILKKQSNAAKLIEKYNDLAREALSNGDKILSENYLKHSDNFARILNSQDVSKIVNLETNKATEKDLNEKNEEVIIDNKVKEESAKAAD